MCNSQPRRLFTPICRIGSRRRKDLTSRFEQPLMQPDVPMIGWCMPGAGRVGEHARVFLSETVHKGTEPVTYVSHDAEDGAWQFLG